jgi:hypothetical protein
MSQAIFTSPLRPSPDLRESHQTVVPVVPVFNLQAWRRERLARMKQTPQYKTLPKILQRLVNHCVLTYESPDKGIYVNQENLAKLKKFRVSRKTMHEYLKEIVRAGVFTCQPRYRGRGTRGGRASNVYRLNESLIAAEAS